MRLLTEGLSHNVLHFQVVFFFLFLYKQMTSEDKMDGETLYC